MGERAVIDPVVDEVFKAAMRLLPAGVVMVTTRVDGRPWGLTVSACCSLSVAPPLVLVSVGSQTASSASILDSERFGLSLLGAAQKQLAERGARVGASKFIDGFLESRGLPGLRSPMVDGALCHLDCALREAFQVSDHTIVVGEVERAVPATLDREPDPLVYFNRAFRRVGEVIA